MKKKHTNVIVATCSIRQNRFENRRVFSCPILSESSNACRHVQYEEILTRWKSIPSIHTPVVIGNFMIVFTLKLKFIVWLLLTDVRVKQKYHQNSQAKELSFLLGNFRIGQTSLCIWAACKTLVVIWVLYPLMSA